MKFIIKQENSKASVINAVEKLMEGDRPHMWLQFLVDVQSIAIHLNIADLISSMDEAALQSIALRTTDLAQFFTDLIDIQQEEEDDRRHEAAEI